MPIQKITSGIIQDGAVAAADIVSVSNTAISGLITASQIAAVSNTAITGLIQASQIGSANATLVTSGTLPGARLPVGSVLQVVQATLAGTQAVSGASAWADVTSERTLSVSITPTSASSKILVSFVVNCDGENNLYFRILRGATVVGVGNADGSRQQVSAGNAAISGNSNGTTMMMNQFLDSPATTSSTTYKIQAYCDSSAGSGTYYINYASGDANNAHSSRCISSITVMEIAA
jgi:hypothetical protein